MRTCGECQQCCETAEILDTDSPAGSPCRHQCATGCAIHATDAQPRICQAFQCAWRRGVGGEADRPDLVGAMFSINATPRGSIGFVIETRPDAVQTTARAMVLAFVRELRLPLIVSLYGRVPPHDTGDQVVLKREHVLKALSMRGPFVAQLDEDVAVYQLAGAR